MLPATWQRWHSRPYPSRSRYSIKRPQRDARLSWGPLYSAHPAHPIATPLLLVRCVPPTSLARGQGSTVISRLPATPATAISDVRRPVAVSLHGRRRSAGPTDFDSYCSRLPMGSLLQAAAKTSRVYNPSHAPCSPVGFIPPRRSVDRSGAVSANSAATRRASQAVKRHSVTVDRVDVATTATESRIAESISIEY